MPDFLHVTPGWIIGYLSSLQGYEGSLIKLTSKQVRWLPTAWKNYCNTKHVDEMCSSNRDWNSLHWTNCFHRVILIWLLAKKNWFKLSFFYLPACWVCNLWQSVWSWSCKKCTECKHRLVFLHIYTLLQFWIFSFLKFSCVYMLWDLFNLTRNSDWENKT